MRRAAIANHSAIVTSLRAVTPLRVVCLVRRGPLGGSEDLWLLFSHLPGSVRKARWKHRTNAAIADGKTQKSSQG